MSIAVDTSEPSRRSSGEVRNLESLLNHKTMGEEILPERHSTSREQMNRCSYRTKGAPRVLGPPSLPPPGLSGLPAPPRCKNDGAVGIALESLFGSSEARHTRSTPCAGWPRAGASTKGPARWVSTSS